MNLCPLECGFKIKSFYNHYKRCNRKDLLDKVYIKCKFDYNHIVKKEEYERHLEICDKKFESSEEEEVKTIYIEKQLDSDSDDGDLSKILKKIPKKNKICKNEETADNSNIHFNKIININFSDNIVNNSAFFQDETEIDEDSRNFYDAIYNLKAFDK